MHLLPQHASRSSGLGFGGLQMSHQPLHNRWASRQSESCSRCLEPEASCSLEPPFRWGNRRWLSKRGFGPMQPCFVSCGSVQVSDLLFWRLHTTSNKMLGTSGNRHVAGASLFSSEYPLCLDCTLGTRKRQPVIISDQIDPSRSAVPVPTGVKHDVKRLDRLSRPYQRGQGAIFPEIVGERLVWGSERLSAVCTADGGV